MYEQHFGLTKNPFQSVAEDQAVFQGPEQAKVVAALKTALTTRDSIAVITGPVGVGKTTIVHRALQEMGSERLVASLGRTQVGSEELVDMLLGQFGVVREPTRRFECLKTFNRILNERAASGARVFIVIEDAERLGPELLEELEALTAADGGASAGANVILMGRQKLDKLVATPELERVRQRVRLQRALERFNAAEVEAYLRHRIKSAGGDFDAMFEPGTALMIRRCSGGIPRVINGLCETALTVAAQNQMTQVTPRIIFKIAVEVFGMDPGEAPPPQVRKTPPAQAEKVAKPKPAKARAPEPATPKTTEPTSPQPLVPQPQPAARQPEAAPPKPAANKPTEPVAPVQKVPAAPDVTSKQPILPAAPKPAAKQPTSPPAAGTSAPDGKPSLAETRLPDLQGLGVQDKAPAAAAQAEPMPDLPPKFKFADEIVVDRDTKPKLPSAPKRVQPPEPPKLDIEDDTSKVADEAPKAEQAPTPPSAATDEIPTLGDSSRVETLGKAQQKPALETTKPVSDAATAEAAKQSPVDSLEEPDPPAQRSEAKLQEPPAHVKRSEPEVEEPTASFAKVDHNMLDEALASLAVHDREEGPDPEATAKNEIVPVSLPEVTLDKNIEAQRPAAKTEPDTAALKQLAQAKSLEDVSDKLAETLFNNEELEAISLKIRENAAQEDTELQQAAEAAAATPAPKAELPQAPAKPEAPKALAQPAAPSAPEPPAASGPADLEKPVANTGMSAEPAVETPPPESRGPQPEPIENQFNTSITATLKTLSAHSKPKSEDDEDEESSGSNGLLGRLKDSFKS